MPTRFPGGELQPEGQGLKSRAAASPPVKELIADESAPVAEMLRDLISQAGRIEVVGTADSEASAMAAIRTLAPDAVVLDLQLKAGCLELGAEAYFDKVKELAQLAALLASLADEKARAAGRP